MATEKQITEKWGATHHIQKQRMVGEIELSYLTKHESVAMGDGETFYWLLTEKTVAKNNLVQADVSGQSELLFAFIAEVKKEFADQNWDSLDFIAERVLKANNSH